MLPKVTTPVTIMCVLMNCTQEPTQMTSTQSISTEGTRAEETTTEGNCAIICTGGSPQNYTHHTVLDPDGIFHLYWEPPQNKTPDSNISMKVEVQTTGYFGFGFSPNGGMPGSDIVTGWFRDCKVFFQDRHATAFALPPKDDQENYILTRACKNDTHLSFEFYRMLDTCDEQDMVITETTMRLIYAFRSDVPPGDDPQYHGRVNRGARSVNLLNQNDEGRGIDISSLSSWNLTSPDIDLSNYTTLYWCKIFKSPEVSEKQHIIYVKPLIQEGHERIVHHITVYECPPVDPKTYEDLLEYRGHECWKPETPFPLLMCQGFTFAWAIGGRDIALPGHVGLPLNVKPNNYMVEFHYDNPLLQNVTDHSGLSFLYTDVLRQYDGANYMVGANILPRVLIPPHVNPFVVAAHSSPNCFQAALPESGIQAFSVLPHAHLLARRIVCRHFRNGTELRPLVDDKYFDFDYQDYTEFPEEVTVLPTDQITAECYYDSSEREKVTFGGQSTKEEMCACFILYYPQISSHMSLSGATFSTINRVLNTSVQSEEDVVRTFSVYDWSSVNMDDVQNGLRFGEQDSKCIYGEYPPSGEQHLVSYPSNFEPYVEERSCKG